MNENISTAPLSFVEDLLLLVHQQLAESVTAYESMHQEACSKGLGTGDRIHHLVKDLERCVNRSVSAGIPAFVVIDGYDRMHESLQSCLDHELNTLQDLSVLISRRAPTPAPQFSAVCDCCRRRDMKVYWVCQQCEERQIHFWLCYSCKDGGKGCKNCGDGGMFVEPQHHINLEVFVGDTYLQQYVTDELNSEFGTIRDSHADKMSELRNINELRNDVCNYIIDKARGNITLARLYLDDVLAQKSLADFDTTRVRDRLPSSIIAFFNSEMASIEALSDADKKLSLFSIALAAMDDYGVPFETLRQRFIHHTRPIRSMEDVLQASNGWLLEQNDKHQRVATFAPTFSTYVNDDYNESLAWARRVLMEEIPTQGEVESIEEHEPQPATASGSLSSDLLSNTSYYPTPPESSFDTTSQVPSPEIMHRPRTITEKAFVQSPPTLDSAAASNRPSLAIQSEHISSLELSSMDFSRNRSRICGACEHTMLGSGKVTGEHHILSTSTERLATPCIFCDFIHQSLQSRREMNLRPSDEQVGPVYNWKLRHSAQGRMGVESLSLTLTARYANLPRRKQFYLFDDKAVQAPDYGDLGHSTDPGINGGSQMKKWIEQCNHNHHGCRKPSSKSFLPTRLLDLQTGDDKIVRLVNTKVSKVEGPYCTLSHAWGTDPLYTTTWLNIEKHLLEGIKWSDLTKNFQEAIQIVRLLGIRYIWIDSLCIVQKDFSDFNAEGALMHKVYRNSYCTIAAVDSKESAGGLFRPREDLDKVLPVSYKGARNNALLGTTSWKVLDADLWNSELLGSHIYTRGWVFQERMLSPRILHFARNQIFWDCATISACETLPNGLPPQLDGYASTDRHWRGRLAQKDIKTGALVARNDDESPYTFWISAVQTYTMCNLTQQSDKNLAIWSVAKTVRDILGEEYAVGLWSGNLVEQLAWRVQDNKRTKKLAELQIDNPSWSWTSIFGPINPQYRIADRDYRVSSHQGGPLCFVAHSPGGDRDQCPVLENKALDVCGFIRPGQIQTGIDSSGQDKIFVSLDLESTTNADVSPKCRVLEMKASLDEDASRSQNSELYATCKFLLLAASQDLNDYDFDASDTEDEVSTTYFGIGLILIERDHWYDLQEDKLSEVQEQHDQIAVKKDHLFCLQHPCADRKELESLRRLKQLRHDVDSAHSEPRFRRLGAVQFHDLDQESYNLLRKGEQTKMWLE